MYAYYILYIYKYIYMYIYILIYIYIYIYICIYIYYILYICILYIYICLSVCFSCVSICVSVCLLLYLSVYLPVCLSVYLLIYLSFHFYNISFWPLFSYYNFDLTQIQILFFGVRDIMLEAYIGGLCWRHCRKKFVIRNCNMLSLQLLKRISKMLRILLV